MTMSSQKEKKRKKRRSGTAIKVVLFLVLLVIAAVLIVLNLSNHSSSQITTSETTSNTSSVPSVTAVPTTPEVTPEPKKTISLGTQEIEEDVAELKLDTAVTSSELIDAIQKFPQLTRVDVKSCNYSDADKRLLSQTFPGIDFVWSVSVDGSNYDSSTKTITVSSPEAVDTYASVADLLPNVSSIQLSGGEYTPEQAAVLTSAWENAVLEGSISMFDLSFAADSEEVDFSNITISLDETQRFSSLVQAMPNLKKVIMTDCGIGDEDMEALNKSYDNVQFVWTVYFKVYSVRTDADRFCASDLPWNNYVAWPMTDANFAPLKYCHDLVALDVGHENVSDLSFLYEMPKLRYLILATVHNELDLTPIASLKDLYYLEVFHNPLVSLEPLLECKNLRHLNIGNCSGDFSIEPLLEMTYLERMWFPMNHLSQEDKDRLVAGLPDTEVYLGNDDEVGGGWRDSDTYHELRAALFETLR